MINLNFKELSVGEQVKTRKGFIFTKTGEDTWRDETSGLIWLPKESGEYNHEEALNLQNDSKRLPTKEEFEESEKHSIRQLLDIEDNWFWSASGYPGSPNVAYVFSGYNGGIYYYGRSLSSGIICVVK